MLPRFPISCYPLEWISLSVRIRETLQSSSIYKIQRVRLQSLRIQVRRIGSERVQLPWRRISDSGPMPEMAARQEGFYTWFFLDLEMGVPDQSQRSKKKRKSFSR